MSVTRPTEFSVQVEGSWLRVRVCGENSRWFTRELRRRLLAAPNQGGYVLKDGLPEREALRTLAQRCLRKDLTLPKFLTVLPC